jgi:flagellum-specific peptidoglycan hydrolase FlgJ
MMFTTDVIAAAQAAHVKWKVWASVSLAQYVVESGGGKHEPAGSNNPFGIKALPGKPSVLAVTHEYIHGRFVTVNARFAKFESVADAFDAHAELIAEKPAYRYVMQAPNPEEFAHRLTGVYATDPHYGDTLVGVMRKYFLEQYDGANYAI